MAFGWTSLHFDCFRGVPCLVTGGAGFIGSHLVDALLELGAKVTVFDDLTAGIKANIRPQATLIRGSIVDQDAVGQAVASSAGGYVFHLAAIVSVPHSIENPTVHHQINAAGTANILEAARHAGVKRLIYSASSSAYGDPPTDHAKTETMPNLPKSPYAATKLSGEMLVRAYGQCYPIDTVSLRYFNIFGSRQRADSPYSGVIARFITLLLNGQRPTITGDGSATRDFTHVSNAVHANLLAASHPHRLWGEVYNTATGVATTILELARTLATLTGHPELSPMFAPPRPGDVLHSRADLTRSREVLGYQPITTFRTGLEQTIQWYKSMT